MVEGYKKFIGTDVNVQKTPGSPGTNLSKSELKQPKYLDKYRSFLEQLMWYTAKVGPDVANASRELSVHMSHPGPEHWKTLGHLIGYLKGKNTKLIIIRKSKIVKAVMFWDSNYATEEGKERVSAV